MESYEYRYQTIITDQATIDRLVEERAEQLRREYNRKKSYAWRDRNREQYLEYQRIRANERYRRIKLAKLEQQQNEIVPEV